ncbi:NADPH-dependent FMN reductase [Oceanobacillus sp. CF4.6]|uniref:NADPH-dependent FMN reductase n=1 Tax=Oceanobacillus sp. CF4.6 TaxID=3373080 RepID=UPI003EE53DF0
MTKIGILVGSLRKESFSKKVAANIAELFPKGFETEFIEIGNLPLYNQDYDDKNNVPAEYTTFRNKIKELDAVLFVTPEYNRSVPAVLSNAIDVGSRPKVANVWNDKPASIISHSPGNLSGFGANHHLRQILVCLNMPVVQQSEAYLSNVAALLDENGKVKNEGTIQFLQSVVDTFVDLIKRYEVSSFVFIKHMVAYLE